MNLIVRLGGIVRPLILAGAVFVCAAMSAQAMVEIDGENIRVRIVDGNEIEVLVLPEKGEGYASLATRMTGRAELAGPLQRANGGKGLRLGHRARIPWELLREEFRYLALRALFPRDERTGSAWIHRPNSVVGGSNHAETLWHVALWFTGDGENWSRIANANRITGADLPEDLALEIPDPLLLPLFRLPFASEDGALRFARDTGGEVAIYNLESGEALYTAVVLRFTGLTSAEDVNQAVETIAQRSHIEDVRDIPVGFPVRIPLELVSSPFLPKNHPRVILAALTQRELDQVRIVRRPMSLDGVHVILDPGHGGKDQGAMGKTIWESDYVYDVACRVKRSLQKSTGANVYLTVTDPKHGCKIFDSRKLEATRNERIATTPPHPISGQMATKVGVNLRWYLANSIRRKLMKKGVDDEKIVFISLHADALHPKLRGAMAYYPSAQRRGSRHKSAGDQRYKKFAEWRESPVVTVSRKDRLRDELLSKKLAEDILEAFDDAGLSVNPNLPARDHIVRTRKGRPQRFVPAVLRGNLVSAKVLFELLNLKNPQDAKVLQDPEGRERLAGAVVTGLRAFFGESGRIAEADGKSPASQTSSRTPRDE